MSMITQSIFTLAACYPPDVAGLNKEKTQDIRINFLGQELGSHRLSLSGAVGRRLWLMWMSSNFDCPELRQKSIFSLAVCCLCWLEQKENEQCQNQLRRTRNGLKGSSLAGKAGRQIWHSILQVETSNLY
jgi:hypothetical protein